MRTQSYAAVGTLCLLLAVLSVGCGAPSSEQAQRPSADGGTDSLRLPEGLGNPEEDSLFAFLQEVDAAPLLNAFADLSSHKRHARTGQFSRNGFRIASRERIVEVGPEEITVLRRDSSGAFDYGYLRPFASDESSARELSTIIQNIVPTDPAYLSERSREAFSYHRAPASLPGYGPVDMVDIRARPETGGDQTIRRARLFFREGTANLIALRIERREGALWFREWTDAFVSVREDRNGRFLPRQYRIESLLRMPFRPLQRFRTVTAFYGFETA